MLRNRYETDYTDQMRAIYSNISTKYGYTARITNIWPLLLTAIGKEEFEILDIKRYNNGSFEAYLIDTFIKWRDGEDLDFSEVYKEILETGDFTSEEKLLMSSSAENILWAIFLEVLDPTLKL